MVSTERSEIAAALLLTTPFVPMLFQGEEWAASAPFQYFTDVDDEEVGNAVREGRRAEFAAFGWKPEDVPDPQDRATYERSKLDWDEREQGDHGRVLRWHRQLTALRADYPSLRDGRVTRTVVHHDANSGLLVIERNELTIAVNLGDEPETIEVRPIESVLLTNDDSINSDAEPGEGPGGSALLLGVDRVAILLHPVE